MTAANKPKKLFSPEVSAAWIRGLPKAELHIHLEGSIGAETLVELNRRRGSTVLTVEQAEQTYRYTDFTGFLMAFKAISDLLRTPADYELITERMLERLAAQGVVHAEVYISVGVVHYWGRAAFDPIFEAVERARVRAEERWGISVYWLFDAVRQFGPEKAETVFRKAAELRARSSSIAGIGIGGDERQAGAEIFRELYREAAEAGLHRTVHAGETAGPESIWAALNIGAERLGHALTAEQDPELMEVLAERQVPLELCISSNVRTGCCRQLAEHPVRRYFDAGLMVTLNSDDPAFFASDLEEEFGLAHSEFGFTREHLRELAANSIEASFLPPTEKVAFLRQIEAYPDPEPDGSGPPE